MSYDTTTRLGLKKPDYNTEKNTWGALHNENCDDIDAFAQEYDTFVAKAERKLLSGTQASAGLVTLALDTNFTTYRLILSNLSSAGSQAFCRFSDGSNDPATSNYDYARTDLSTKSGGTQTFAAASNAGAIFLTDVMKSVGSDGQNKGFIVLDISTRLDSTEAHTDVIWRAGYKNNDGSGYRVSTTGAGALLGQTSRSTYIKIGGGSYSDGIRCSYTLIGVPNLA